MDIHSTKPKLSSEVRVSSHSEGAVVLDIRGGHVFSANAVGARILALLNKGKSTDEIVTGIAHEFNAPEQHVRADLDNFLAGLKARNLLQV